MTLSLDQFWKLTAQCQLFQPEEVDALRRQCRDEIGDRPRVSSRLAAEWLVKQRQLTAYQARLLLKGNPGPFQFGDYRILNSRPLLAVPIRRFNGLHVGTNHRVLLHFWLDRSDGAWRQVCERAEAARRIRHPNLDRIYETVATTDGRLGVSEWPEGVTFQELLRQRKHVPAAQACLFVQQIASGLAHTHALGVVHGHLGLGEVVMQPGGHIKVLRPPFGVDFPLRLAQSPPGDAARYLAPEFLQPGMSPDPLTDVYALGCMLYELIAGVPPFRGETFEQVMTQHATERIQPLHESSIVPTGLMEVISFMMAKRRELRYPEMNEVVDKLNAFVPTGIRQTTPRARATESYYLAQLEKRATTLPQHLAGGGAASGVRPPAVIPVDPAEPSAQESASDDRPPAGDPIVVVEPSLPSRRLSRQSHGARKLTWSLRAFSAATVVVLLLALSRPWGQSPRRAIAPAESGRTMGTASTHEPNATELAGTASPPSQATMDTTLVDDDGRTLWAAPTTGHEIDLSATPAGAQLFIHVRPRSLIESPEGEAILRALGPGFARVRESFERRTQLNLADIDRLLIAFDPRDVGPPQVSYVIELSSGLRRQLWDHVTQPRILPGGQLAVLEAQAVLFPEVAPNCVVFGDEAELEAILAGLSEPIPLRRELETLRRASDADRHVTLLGTPNFLAADGRSLLTGPLEILRQPLLDFLGDATQAVSFSLHSSEGTYVELRWVCPSDENPLVSVGDGRHQLERLPERLNTYLGSMRIEPYWQPLAIRFPLMMNFLAQQVRGGVDGRMAILNATLPPGAAHNLILASELAMSSTLLPTVSTGSAETSPVERSIEQVLQLPANLIVDQQSLEAVLEEFAESVRQEAGIRDFFILIEGQDLQLDGITRNQQIRDLRLEGQTVQQVLTQLVIRANPAHASDPRQAAQKLVWVVSPHETPGVLITTRTAAGQKGYSLPPEFVAE